MIFHFHRCLPYFMPKVPVYVIQKAIPSYTNESIICRCYFLFSDTKVISGTFTNIDQFPPSPEQLKKMAEKYKFYRY